VKKEMKTCRVGLLMAGLTAPWICIGSFFLIISLTGLILYVLGDNKDETWKAIKGN